MLRVCFVDAHLSDIPEPVKMIRVKSEFQRSPFTHHLTARSLFSVCETLSGKKPETVLLSVRGHRFQFGRVLSLERGARVPQAVGLIISWLAA